MTTDTNATTDKPDTPDLSWIEEATRPSIDYWTAQHLITKVLALVPDSEFAHFDFEREENADGTVILTDFDPGLRFLIGNTDPVTRRPVLPHRTDGVDQLMEREAIHRLDVAHWTQRLAADKDYRKQAARELVEERLSHVVAEDVVAGRVVHNVETGVIINADVATDEDRAEAAAAYARFLKAWAEQ